MSPDTWSCILKRSLRFLLYFTLKIFSKLIGREDHWFFPTDSYDASMGFRRRRIEEYFKKGVLLSPDGGLNITLLTPTGGRATLQDQVFPCYSAHTEREQSLDLTYSHVKHLYCNDVGLFTEGMVPKAFHEMPSRQTSACLLVLTEKCKKKKDLHTSLTICL